MLRVSGIREKVYKNSRETIITVQNKCEIWMDTVYWKRQTEGMHLWNPVQLCIIMHKKCQITHTHTHTHNRFTALWILSVPN